MINHTQHSLPSYENAGYAGLFLRARLPEAVELKPLDRKVIPTGLFIELPSGYEAQIRPRSGLEAKKGLTLLNTPGTIDSDYRGEIKIIVVNLSDIPQLVENGERIAQMIIAKYERIEWEVTNELEATDRGAGGFGHTGIK